MCWRDPVDVGYASPEGSMAGPQRFILRSPYWATEALHEVAPNGHIYRRYTRLSTITKYCLIELVLTLNVKANRPRARSQGSRNVIASIPFSKKFIHYSRW